MGRILLVTGGCRSGKSAYAEERARSLPERRIYLATCPVLDEELAERIARHRERRAEDGWETREEELDLEKVLQAEAEAGVILVECMTLWINNLLYAEEQGKIPEPLGEGEIARRTQEIAAAAVRVSGTVVFVTNEVGLGVVPENALARRYRDLVGRCNQTLAQLADEVVLLSCGLPLVLKKNY